MKACVTASPRGLLNIFQADAIGGHIISLTNELLQRLPLVGGDVEFSLDTVKMLFNHGQRVSFLP
jgi:transaldolase